MYFLGIILAAVVFAGVSLKYRRLRNRIIDTPTSKIRSLAKGLVEVRGEISYEHPIKSFISKQDCAYYETVLEVMHIDNKGYRTWRRKDFLQSSNEFEVVDDTGKVVVNPIGVEVILSNEATVFYVDKDVKALKDVTSDKIIKSSDEFNINQGDQRVVEKMLKKKDEVYVLGFAWPRGESMLTRISKGRSNIFYISQGDLKTAYERIETKYRLFVSLTIIAIMILLIYYVSLYGTS